jgi:putative transposase
MSKRDEKPDKSVAVKAEDEHSTGHSMLNVEEPLPWEVKKRLEVIQRLKSYKGTPEYRLEKIRATEELGISDSSLRRLIQQYNREGLEGLIRKRRGDRGEIRKNVEWEEFILKSYKEGNRGTKSTSVAQIANLVKSKAKEIGEESYPGRSVIYRLLEAEVESREQKEKSLAIGWRGEELRIKTKEGIELDIKYSNQVWQCDHTPADILVVDREGEVLGRPTLTTVIDTYSRCIVGMNIGLEMPSAAVTCLALRNAIAPKQYGASYELKNRWPTYGVPGYLYTDAGSDFTSQHIDQIAASLGITLCLRRKPSDGGIVERPFGTLNSEFFSTLPGYTTSQLKGQKRAVEAEACITLEELEKLLVRYIIDRYNQLPDARGEEQSRVKRWEEGMIVQPELLDGRELDILLMRQERRCVYKGGYIRFANEVYKGEYLGGYAGQEVVLRYNPRDITTLLVYRQQEGREVFLARAHAQKWYGEKVSLAEAKAKSSRKRKITAANTSSSVLEEVGARHRFIEELGSPKRRAEEAHVARSTVREEWLEEEEEVEVRPLPEIKVYDYEELRQRRGM